MGSLKTYLFAAALTISPPTAHAVTGDADDLTRFFARCTGQFSALMEFQWLTNDPAADQTEQYRAQMIDLLEAVMPTDQGRAVLSLRINAKVAFAALLHRGYFSEDAEDAVWVQTRVDREIANCRGLLLN